MELTNWNSLRYLGEADGLTPWWTNFRPARGASELYAFSVCVTGWLPAGRWNILQIDNSSYLRATDMAYLGALIGVGEPITNESHSIFFDFDGDEADHFQNEMLLAAFCHHFLLHEQHCYIVSSGSDVGGHFALQDGFVYFISRTDQAARAQTLIESYKATPLGLPEWAWKYET